MGFCPICGEIVPAGKTCRRCNTAPAQASEGARVSDSLDKKENISDRYVQGVIVEGDIETGIARVLNLNEAGQHAVDVLTKKNYNLGDCAGCGRKLKPEDAIISAKGKSYHKDCFNMEFKCKKCGKPMFGEVIEAADGVWHPDCFRCIKCNKLLSDQPYSNNKGNPICDVCIEEIRARNKAQMDEYEKQVEQAKAASEQRKADLHGQLNPKCGKCGQEVMGQGIQIDDKVWHSQCFVCAGCTKEIGASEFALVNNAPYHPECAAKAKGQVCPGCKKPITGPYVNVDGAKWHKNCLVCEKCGTNVSGGFCDVDGKKMCQKCADSVAPTTQEYTVNPSGRKGGFYIDQYTGKKVMMK